jgi:hypothetical protein
VVQLITEVNRKLVTAALTPSNTQHTAATSMALPVKAGRTFRGSITKAPQKGLIFLFSLAALVGPLFFGWRLWTRYQATLMHRLSTPSALLSPLQLEEQKSHSSSAILHQRLSSGSGSSSKLRKLPSLKNGGVVIFFHNPKTGGTSINKMLLGRVAMFKRRSFPIEQIYKYLEEWTTTATLSPKVKMVEIHGEGPGFLELIPKLREWRLQAAQHNIPIFVFTLLRDPLDWLLSCFNFFCGQIPRYTNCTAEPTVEGLLTEARPNPQTRWYCTMSTIMAVNPQPEVDMSQCYNQDLLELLSREMDFVGFTEYFDETIRVLEHVVPANSTKAFKVLNKTQRPTIKRKKLNDTMTNNLKQMMHYDYELYRGLRERFLLNRTDVAAASAAIRSSTKRQKRKRKKQKRKQRE